MAEHLRLALCQMELVWEDPESNFRAVEDILDDSGEEWDLLILPEMFSTGYTMNPRNLCDGVGLQTEQWIKDLSRRYGGAVTGSTVYHTENGFTNRLIFADPDLDVQYRYDKRHLFTLAGEHREYVGGREQLLVNFRGWRIFPLICYDLRFPVWSRNTLDYDLLLYVANWPMARISAWDVLLRARAIENMAYCAGVNRIGKDGGGYEYPGHSALIDPLGRVEIMAEGQELVVEKIAKSTLKSLRDKFRFLDDRDRFDLKA